MGAINRAKLADGEGAPDQGLQGLEGHWLALQTNPDMYLEEDWLNNIDVRIKELLTETSEGNLDAPPPAFEQSA